MDTNRIVRDIDEGILTLSHDGTILSINPAAASLLGLSRDYTGLKYFMLMDENAQAENDDFHQMVLDAIADKERLHRKLLRYRLADGSAKTLEVTSSALSQEESAEADLLLSFSDRTEEQLLRQRSEDSSANFVGLLCALCCWNFLFALWDFLGQPISASIISKLMLPLLLIPVIICRQHLHLTPADMGLQFKNSKKAIVTDVLITLCVLLIFVLVKKVILYFDPDFFGVGAPFIVWDKYPSSEYVAYAFSAMLQELLSRGIVHEVLRRMMPERNVNVTSIIVSSLFFGALHIHLGLVYMLGAVLLLGILGVVYNRQRSIWGLCIVHYTLGMAIGLFDFVAY